MRKTFLITAALAAAAAPIAVSAQEAESTPVPGESREDILRGVQIFHLFSGAVQAKEVSREQKSALVTCLYNNRLRNISVATGKVLANSEKLDASKPGHVFAAASAVCGWRGKKAQSGGNATGEGR